MSIGIYVKVKLALNEDGTTRTNPDGTVYPEAVIYQGKQYRIVQIVDVRRDVIRKTGSVGYRYTVEFTKGQRRWLFQSIRPSGVWVVEKQDVPQHPARHCCGNMFCGVPPKTG